MARPDAFSGVTEFLAVASRGSFRAAAAELRVTTSAVSRAVKALESRLGTPLFLRTTRSVAPTDAGRDLLARLRPAADEIRGALDNAGAAGEHPSGELRLTIPRIAVEPILARVLPGFARKCPRVRVEVDVSDVSVDLATAGLDAGIRIGGFIERDMLAVRLTPDFRWAVYGSPSYLRRRGTPSAPAELVEHACIGYRFPTSRSVYRWRFRRGAREFTLEVPGGVVVNDHLTMIALARAGAGLAYTADFVVANAPGAVQLRSVLADWGVRTPGLFLYFPAKSQLQPKLRAFIDHARAVLATPGPARPTPAS